MKIIFDNSVETFSNKVQNLCNVDVYACYQCGKCSAGCSVGNFITESPSKLIRLIQLNQEEIVLASETPYLCAACNICSSRCPMGIDVAKIMEIIRILAAKENINPVIEEVSIFSKVFLNSVKSNGRIFELGMTIGFNLYNKTPLKDAAFGPAMLLKSKLSLLPSKIKNRKKIKDIFSKSDYFSTEELKKR